MNVSFEPVHEILALITYAPLNFMLAYPEGLEVRFPLLSYFEIYKKQRLWRGGLLVGAISTKSPCSDPFIVLLTCVLALNLAQLIHIH